MKAKVRFMLSQHTLNFIDSWLSFRFNWIDAPGMSVGILKDGDVLFDTAYGFANLETNQQMTTQHVFQIASHSKSFTATAILSLQEKELLRIDDRVIKYLPWLSNHTDIRWSEVTIRQLMSHSAGIIRDGNDADFWQLTTPFPNSGKLKETALKTNLTVTPNTQMKYSNLGYALLGEVIATITNGEYEEYISKCILKPLQLKHTYVDIDGISPTAALATGYSRQFTKNERMTLPKASANALRPATGLWSNPTDLCRFYSALLTGSNQLLSDASKREMQRVQWGVRSNGDAYGLGLQLEKYDNFETYGHMGGFPGFTTKTITDESSGITICVMMNSHDGEVVNIIENLLMIIHNLGEYSPSAKELSFEGRFASLGGCIEVVATKNGLRQIMLSSNSLFKSTEELYVVDNNTLNINKASVFSNKNESLIYRRNQDGSVDQIVRGGITMYPSATGNVKNSLKFEALQ